MSHSALESIPDVDTREVLSEVFIPGGYKFSFDTRGGLYESDQGFPPEPAHITNVTAAYLTQTGDVKTRQVAGLAGDHGPSLEELIDLYSGTIGRHQELIHEIILPPNFGELSKDLSSVEAMQDWMIEATRKDSKRLLVAHFVGRVARDDSLVDAIAIPKVVHEDLPLLFRHVLTSLMPTRDEIVDLIGQEQADEFRRATGPLLRRENSSTTLADVAATSFLPNARDFREATSRSYPKLGPKPTKRTNASTKKHK